MPNFSDYIARMNRPGALVEVKGHRGPLAKKASQWEEKRQRMNCGSKAGGVGMMGKM